jgi:putative Holliday junction resolvase
MRVLAVDPGEKRLGIALSDPTGVIASPLTVIQHVSRAADAAKIIQVAQENEAGIIVIGQALDEENRPTLQSRRAARLAHAIREQTELPVELWDESGSTQAARSAYIQMGVKRSKRRGHLDDIAATVILQSYLDVKNPPSSPFHLPSDSLSPDEPSLDNSSPAKEED